MLALTIAAYAIGIVLLGCGGAILLSMQLARRSAAPFFPSSAETARAAFRAAALKPGEVMYDLGAGTGTAMIVAAKEFGADARGFEISLLPYLIARAKIILTGAHGRLSMKDLFKQDVADADVVFLYLAERVLPRIAEKLRHELKPGARIVSYAFALPGMEPAKTIPIMKGWDLYVYRAQ